MWRFVAVVCVAACGRLDFETTGAVHADAAPDALDAASVVLPAPVGWWKLDETTGTSVSDSSGHALNGMLSGNATWTSGHTGNGISLDGTNQYAQIADDAALRISGSWTLSLWVWLNAVPADTEMYTLAAKTDANGNENYSLRVDNNYGQFGATGPGSFVAQFASGNAADTYAVYTPVSIDAGRWISVVGTWSAQVGMLAIYVDGQSRASTSAVMDPTSLAGQPFLIGDNAGHLMQDTPGVLDDVRLYDVALSPEEVAALYAGG